ncbi:MAG: hypothetical protein NXI19_18540 [Alphaproteobacteria bacterium]|nr:hypothetical protein [Alphaproteobacteria bacterium]
MGQLTYFNKNGVRTADTFFDQITVDGDPNGAFQPYVRVKSLSFNRQNVRITIRVG